MDTKVSRCSHDAAKAGSLSYKRCTKNTGEKREWISGKGEGKSVRGEVPLEMKGRRRGQNKGWVSFLETVTGIRKAVQITRVGRS